MYFESDTVKSDCPVQIFRKMMTYINIKYRLLVYLTSFAVLLEILKKEEKSSEKERSENDQLIGHFQSVFIYFLFVPRP